MHQPTVQAVSLNMVLSVPSGPAPLSCLSSAPTASRQFTAWNTPRESTSSGSVALPLRSVSAEQALTRPSAVRASAAVSGKRGHCRTCSTSARGAGQWISGDPVGDLLLARMTGRVTGQPAMITCAAVSTAAPSGGQSKRELTDVERELLLRAATIADASAGLSAPHPNFGCVLAHVNDSSGASFAAPSHASSSNPATGAAGGGVVGAQIEARKGDGLALSDPETSRQLNKPGSKFSDGGGAGTARVRHPSWDVHSKASFDAASLGGDADRGGGRPGVGEVTFPPPPPHLAAFVVGEGSWYAQGTPSAEELAVVAAGERARGATAFLNLEPAHGTGERAAVDALVQGGVARVVIGLLHPLPMMRGRAAATLRAAGLVVEVLGVDVDDEEQSNGAIAAAACLSVNRPLVYRCATKRPYSVLKYAMTLDGKIAAASGHSAWVSCTESRALVFRARARSDAVIVGGNTVRRDNPRLTTRREGGHQPIRIVMSKTGHLPMDANVWDVDHAPTILMTQHGVEPGVLAKLRSRGVEVVSFPQLTPAAVMEYCYLRGFLQVLWECGGTLSAPAITDGVIHRVMSFIAPKIIGGRRAPTPVGDLGLDMMTDAMPLSNVEFQLAGCDVLVTGDLLGVERTPNGGPLQLASDTERARSAAVAAGLAATTASICARCLAGSSRGDPANAASSGGNVNSCTREGSSRSLNGSSVSGSRNAAAVTSPVGTSSGSSSSSSSSITNATSGGASNSASGNRAGGKSVAEAAVPQPAACVPFFKSWDAYGALSNFSAHPILLPCAGEECTVAALWGDGPRDGKLLWKTVEAFYQAHKFIGWCDGRAAEIQEEIRLAPSPEDAAQIGRRMARMYPKLVRPDWNEVKEGVMYSALRAKFTAHADARSTLLSTCDILGGQGGMLVGALDLPLLSSAAPSGTFAGNNNASSNNASAINANSMDAVDPSRKPDSDPNSEGKGAPAVYDERTRPSGDSEASGLSGNESIVVSNTGEDMGGNAGSGAALPAPENRNASKASSAGTGGSILGQAGQVGLVELSPHDYVWGSGRDGSGRNLLGKLLMKLREELRDEEQNKGEEGIKSGEGKDCATSTLKGMTEEGRVKGEGAIAKASAEGATPAAQGRVAPDGASAGGAVDGKGAARSSPSASMSSS